jgi:hypothetical protein
LKAFFESEDTAGAGLAVKYQKMKKLAHLNI